MHTAQTKLFSKILPPSGHTEPDNILTIAHTLFCTDNVYEEWPTDTMFFQAIFPTSSPTLPPLITGSEEMGGKTAEQMMIISKANMLSVTKEANTRHILGTFLIFLSKFANEQKILTGTLSVELVIQSDTIGTLLREVVISLSE